jgi:YebC/PmpR family DNA-binding regulatory protein
VAGHSKWKNIQHRKGRQDAIKGKIFTKFAREIYVAARKGDKDPENNNQLRLAIAKAKAQNMPNENIDRAIKKATGEGDGKIYETITYEGYGPDGIAVLVESLTDNRNRTAADVRHIFSKHGGNLGEAGSVSWMFKRLGVVVINKEEVSQDVEEICLEQDPDDIEVTDSTYEVFVRPDRLEEIQRALEEQGLPIASAEVSMVPENRVAIHGETVGKLFNLIDALEENDDVQAVYLNMDVDEEALARYS